MGFRCGIVGVPNAGKSTLFNALTNSSVAAESFPFSTIAPNVGMVTLKDPRLDSIAKLIGVSRKVPEVLEFVDIAGLVKGASRGEGLGNRFLAHIREMDLIVHVVRTFGNDASWENNISTVNLELVLADLDTVEKAITRAQKYVRTGDQEQIEAFRIFKLVKNQLERDETVNISSFDEKEKKVISSLHLLLSKPKFYVFNLGEDQLPDLGAFAAMELDAPVVPICALIEAELGQFTEAEQRVFREELELPHSALQDVAKTGYSILGLQTFFTFNASEVRAWTIPNGTALPQAAGKIHTDMEKGFIRAEVMSCSDFLYYGSEQAVKNAGRFRVEGKTYFPEEGDIIRIRFHS